jgi:hypothetical protein|uniref:Uncharacterized protein n=1 Tax=Siphoviridae sp. ctjjE1 TaxID=2823595 RepID=A0A8S5LD46_9CAUD|nr:MAG TPA: hypothetical protein [Siphoviridae sp. ctjjE1]
MYFITEKNSETGKKFQKIANKLNVCFENQKALAKKYGFTSWRGAYWVVAGGISSVMFPKGTTIDIKVWKEVKKGEYMPRLNTKQGKAIQADLEQAITISKAELNACIGWDEGFSKHIGFCKANNEYFGFTIDDDWTDIIIPNDCTEITATKYRELFKE